MTSPWRRLRNSLILCPVVSATVLAASGCATPTDRCNEYVAAMNRVIDTCGGAAEPFNIVDPRDPDRVGCRYVASIDSPREIVRCVNFLNDVAENVECDIPEVVEFPENLPAYCDVGAFGLVE